MSLRITDTCINAAESGLPLTGNAVTATTYPKQHWKGLAAEIDELQGPGRHLAKKCADCAWLAVCLEERGGHVELRAKPDHSERRGQRGDVQLYLVPAGLPVWERAEHIAFARRISFFFDPMCLQEAGHNVSVLCQLSRIAVFSDPAIRQIATMLADEIQQGCPNGRLYSESLAMALAAALLAVAGKVPKQARGGLAPRSLQRVIDYLEEKWRDQVSLADLAQLSGISQSHFGRAFKASTGIPPSRWQMNIRIRHAQDMLLSAECSLADIALHTGFADQSHFTRTFRQVAGTSPGAWRKSRV